jgi:hypothetical protein
MKIKHIIPFNMIVEIEHRNGEKKVGILIGINTHINGFQIVLPRTNTEIVIRSYSFETASFKTICVPTGLDKQDFDHLYTYPKYQEARTYNKLAIDAVDSNQKISSESIVEFDMYNQECVSIEFYSTKIKNFLKNTAFRTMLDITYLTSIMNRLS